MFDGFGINITGYDIGLYLCQNLSQDLIEERRMFGIGKLISLLSFLQNENGGVCSR